MYFLTRLSVLALIFLTLAKPCFSKEVSREGIVLPDGDRQLNSDLVLQRLLAKNGTDFNGKSFPHHIGNYWFAVELDSDLMKDEAPKAIRLANAHFKIINLYLYFEGQLVQTIKSGYRAETEGVHTYSVDWIERLNMQESGRYQVVINVSSPVVSALNVNYEKYDKALIKATAKTGFLFFLIGITASLAIYNILIGLSVRDYIYFLYALHSLCGTLFVISAYGLFRAVFGFYDDELNFYKPATIGLQFFGTWFCYVFLRIPKNLPKLAWVYKGFMFLFLGLLLLYPVLNSDDVSLISSAAHPFFNMLMVGSAWAVYRQGLKPALFLFVGWSALLVGSTVPALSTVGLFPSFEGSLFISLFCLVFEMYMLSLAISNKFRTIQLQSIATEEVNRSRSAFISYFSHEVKTPIVGMLGLSKMLRNTALTKIQGEYVEKINRSCNQLLQQLNSVLLSESDQKRPPQHQPTCLLDVLETSVTLAEGVCNDKNVEINYSIDPLLPSVVDTDSNLLQQVVNNLVSNAAKYTAEGCITIRCEQHSKAEGRLVVRLIVTDTGIGIPLEDQDQIFNAFTKASNNTQGIQVSSGVGLAVVKEICQRLEATISFESKPMVGSVFTVDIPVLVRSPQAKFNKNLAVLVVDDVELNTEIICSLLQDEGHVTTSTNDPVAALVMVQDNTYDVILVDIHMPVMNGDQLFSKIRAEGFSGPVIGISAGLTDELSQHLRKSGMDLLMEKPFSSAVFYSLLEREKASDVTQSLELDVNKAFLLQLKKGRSSAEISDLFERFGAQCTNYLKQLETGEDRQNAAAMALTSHSLAGLVSTFGLRQAGSLAKNLAELYKEQLIDWAEISSCREKLNGSVQDGLATLQASLDIN